MLDETESRIETYADDNDELARIYVQLNDLSRRVSELKKLISAHIDENLRSQDLRWGECDIASYGITDPTPRAKIDEKAWQAAVEESMELTKLELEYQKARSPFMYDATQEPRVYIRKKRGA